MNMIYKIAKTELQMLFYSPVAWLVLIIFTFQSGLIFTNAIEMVEREQAMGYDPMFISSSLFGRLFYTVQDYLFLYIPLLTMGLVSRDLAGGTIKLLHSSPMTNTQIILGKFFSMMIFAFLLVGIFVIYVIYSLFMVEHFDVLYILTGILGIYLLICTYASIGLFMSTISSYQIIAAVGTFVLLIFLNFVSSIWQDIDFVRDVTFWLSLRGRAESFTGGLISSEDVVYFIMVPGMFLWFSIIKLSSRVNHSSRGQNAIKYVGVFLVVAFVGYLSSRPHLMGYVDTTRENSRTLTPNSQEIVKKLKGGLTITTYSNLLDDDFMKAIPRYQNYDKERFQEYIRFKPEIKMEYVYYYDSVQNTRRRGFLADLPMEKRARQIAHSHKIKFSRYLNPEQIKLVIDLTPEDNRFVRQVTRESGEKMFLRQFDDMMRDPSEGEISAAFKRMVMELPTVGFLTGHGERNINLYRDRDYACFARDKRFRHALLNQGFDVTEVILKEDIPALINILVIADMMQPLTENEMKRLERYINRGGNLFIVGDPYSREFMNPLVEPFGVEFTEGILVKPTENFQPDLVMAWPTPGALELSYFYENMKNWRQCAAMSGAAGLKYSTDKGFNVVPVLQTDTTGVWNEMETTNFIDDTVRFNPSAGEIEQMYTTVLALSRPMGDREQKIVILGDADCISNAELFKSREEIESGNFYIILGSFSWLSDGEAPVDVRRPKSIDNRLFLGKTGVKITDIAFKWFIPIALLIAAIFVAIRRRGR
ncbi:Gldg family protein [Butyricimonas paravirosa]|uniref:Gldg family protein n=1 Tax=Butyricimonas paravirosa TaxID=1472417 RepID=UPI00210C3CB9|nr:Gldg family protein [Butyricimonas paravirosa]MCQ4874602.1 Gldg family protein [Butyricimonas paravirosa]